MGCIVRSWVCLCQNQRIGQQKFTEGIGMKIGPEPAVNIIELRRKQLGKGKYEHVETLVKIKDSDGWNMLLSALAMVAKNLN